MLFVTIVAAVTAAFLIWKYRGHLVVFLFTHIRSLGAAVVFALLAVGLVSAGIYATMAIVASP